MAYDVGLAERIRELINGEHLTTEKKMFGGLGFMINGNMAVAASNSGGLLVRVDPDESDALVGSTPAELMVMGGRSMQGWLQVGSEHLAGDAELEIWVRRGAAYAAGLPPKAT
ncbi:MAG: TfoX/Sxy family protein [Microlunatus sp.]|nr:TfoX/Sxy family protein [Microlunatus sp.]